MSDLKDILSDLHSALAKEFLARVKSGEATAADLSAARQFLKDNGIDNSVQNSVPLKNLTDALPFSTEETVLPFTPKPN